MLYVLAWYLALSLIAFVVYGIDKRRANRGAWRIKEFVLHLLELLGGWPGAFVAQRKLHHKSKKLEFQLVFWSIVTLHVTGWTVWFYSR